MRKITKEYCFCGALVMVAITLPFANLMINTISIWALIFFWLISNSLKEKIQLLKNNKLIWLFSSLFIMYGVGLLYGDLQLGLFEIEKRLSLLIFPIVIGTAPLISSKKLNITLISFSLSCVLISLICLINTFYINYSQGIDFFSDKFYTVNSYGTIYTYNNSWLFSNENLTKTYGFHPSYFSVYTIFSIFILIYTLIKNGNLGKLAKSLIVVAIVHLLIFNFFLASRIGILSLFILLISAMLFYAHKKEKLLKGFVITFLFVLTVVSFLQLFTPIREKFKSLVSSSAENFQFSGGSSRFQLLESVFVVIKDNVLIGVGTGDLQPALQKIYESENFIIPFRYQHNPHNQFLDIAATLGILGSLFFLISLLYPMYLSYKTNNYLYLIFILLFVFLSLVECPLAMQKGVVWYAFFNSLFAFNSLKKVVEL
ncbi:MAG: O-antigen ligase family protein [Bacteroidota bacterium]